MKNKKKYAKREVSQQAFQLQTKKSLGQHFLEDKTVIECIANAASEAAKAADTINCVEIGPGAGAITKPLLRSGLNVIAIETDERAASLQRVVLGMEFPNTLHVVEQDVLHTLPEDVLSEQNVTDKPVLVGNLPYYITSDILMWFAMHREKFACAIFMVQDEVAERLVSKERSKEYGRLSVRMQLLFKMEKLFKVPPEAFRPPPQVNSAVVKCTPTDFQFDSLEEDVSFGQLTAKLFAGRRKMLRRVMADTVEQLKHRNKDEEFWQEMEKLNIKSDTRPDAIPPHAILGMHRYLRKALAKS